MTRLADLYRELRQRRVIRTALVYGAVFWAAIEVADLLAGADILAPHWVGSLLIAGLAGLPVVLVLSWFLDAPWRRRRGLAVLGDITIILAIGTAALLLAWQQFFTTFSRPLVAIVRLEPTDAREDTHDLARHLERRLRMLLATRPEIRVIETASSLHPGLSELPHARIADLLRADFVLAGTVNQGGDRIRLGAHLLSRSGDLLWSERFEEPMRDLAQLQNRVLRALWPNLPLPAAALVEATALVSRCDYPSREPAIREFIRAAELASDRPDDAVAALSDLINEFPRSGLPNLERARAYLSSAEQLPMARRPVLHNLGMNDLRQAAAVCPDHPEIALLRFAHTQQLESEEEAIDAQLARHPNAAFLMLDAARLYRASGSENKARALALAAWELDPLNPATFCPLENFLDHTTHAGSIQGNATIDLWLRSLPPLLKPVCP